MSSYLDDTLTDEFSKMYNNNKKVGAVNFDRSATWKGVVVDNSDPYRSGRIRAHVEGIIDGGSDVWITPRTGNNFANSGSFIVPPVGSTIYVDFEGGDINKPLYTTGGIPPRHKDGDMISQSIDRTTSTSSEVFASTGGQASYSGETLAPEDAFCDNEDHDNNNYIDVIHRSSKGSVIKIDERDERESLSIIDRVGNLLKFVSPVNVHSNADNAFYRRGDFDASRDLSINDKASRKSLRSFDWYILLKMIQGSLIRILEGVKTHAVVLKSNYNEYTEVDDPYDPSTKIENTSTKSSSITITSHPTESIVLMAGSTRIDIVGNTISLSTSNTPVLVVEDGKVSILADLHVSGTITASNVITSEVDLNSHTHSGVVSGGSKTKSPDPSGSSPSVSSGSKGHEVDDSYDTDLNNRKLSEEYFSAIDVESGEINPFDAGVAQSIIDEIWGSNPGSV